MDTRIQTFIFFDLETTGLYEGAVAPQITEIALVAVSRKSICNSRQNSLPRILHKLVLPVNPKKIISSKVEDMTKLYNEDMMLLQPFESGVYELIMYFLRRLTPPICFVAHNGDAFDYPILLSELKCINEVIDNRILCIDTCKMFKDFFKGVPSDTMSYSSTVNALHAKEIDNLLDDEYNESLSAVLDSVMMMSKKTVGQNIATTSLQKFSCEDKNTKVPDSKYNVNENAVDSSLQNYKSQNNQKTPTSQIMKQQDTVNRPFKQNNYRRKLEFGCETKSPVNFKLASIYEHMFGSNFEDAHSAEADCSAMLRCVIQINDYFLTWSDNNASPLAFCKKIQ
ncbi:exonuclease DPD1, chloroplastic/mitochondrial [Odontomachus brunneus]|uniref:exonuclease DPD1, chloroplastic/mitochondrial n=1 Tax=Odontomachus brunneus TaxID=486640 RepID=UPI0013F260FF|nr:exonuclease DPD1, chloroplastic/mitochondrial [Odontomachus brunneus]XP_032672693.1 exonuclease DPD1, chloroplastic/mitochondrial [Odontomachus brunneus]XP_032672694.1 exonuclease DPD1, chloroplastic/mitochondrial [Odontomachus brunneus]XP_032672695.1 exonuclease DPD1, chloroplastic/mitochondrial [Odontomachus brunneus]XP_032672696.1 exonuclease DPD1, chloroplastic/mitochondrial [Odontomachus brunneus]XP_032672697.1 exonuclease DPD1, chloroplastic/mitochondrial [Odontomachus brunneus]